MNARNGLLELHSRKSFYRLAALIAAFLLPNIGLAAVNCPEDHVPSPDGKTCQPKDPTVVRTQRPSFGGFGGWTSGPDFRVTPTGGGGFSPSIGEVVNQRNSKAGCGNPTVSVGAPETVGNPVVLATGNKVETELDFITSGEVPLGLIRTYNHYWQGAGLFGKHWISNFDYKLTFGTTALNACYPRPGGGSCAIGANTVIYAWRPDGRTIKFIKNANGIFLENKPEAVARIEPQPNGKFHLFAEDDSFEIYSSSGYVERVKSPTNVAWQFTYNGTYLHRVTHTSGRYVEFTWTSGRLTAVRDPAGSFYGFSYTANQFGSGLHRLASSSQPGSPATTTTYHYEIADTTALTGKSYNGVRYSKFTYNASGYATSTEHSGWEKHLFAYTPGANGALSVTHTTPLGKATTFQFLNGKLQSTTGYPSTYCPEATFALIEYDANGYPSMTSDHNGNIVSYTHNAKGQLLQKIEAPGTAVQRVTNYEWWGGYGARLMRETLVGVKSTTYHYTGTRLGAVVVQNLSSHGVANQTQTTWYTYTDYGINHGNNMIEPGMVKSITIDGPLAGSGDATTTHYDTLGNITKFNNSLSHEIVFSNHDGLGNVGRKVGFNGETTDYLTDARGRLLRERTYPNGSTSADITYTYNTNGTLATRVGRDGMSLTYGYDVALRLVSISRSSTGVLVQDSTREQREYYYDLASNVNGVRDSLSELTTSMAFECLGPLGAPQHECYEPYWYEHTVETMATRSSNFTDYDELSRPRAKRGNSSQNVRVAYDLNGNVKTVRDSQNRLRTISYDALDRITSITDAAGGVSHFEYDADDQVTKITDPRGKITAFAYDGFGQLWARSSPDTGLTTYQYNPSGLMTHITRNDGTVLTHNYDGLGRLTWYGTPTEGRGFGYDWCGYGKGRLCNADHANGTRHFGYMPDGRISVTRDWTPTSDEWTSYAYDAIGRLGGISYPSGVSVGYGFHQGKLTIVQATVNGVTHNVVSGLKYQPFGPMAKLTYGNGVIKEKAFDLDGRLTMIHDHGWLGHTQHYNSSNEIVSIENWSRPNYNQQFGYDARSRLTSVTSPSGNQAFEYDANGNRTRNVWAANMPYVIDPNSNRVVSEHISYTYDGQGNRATQSWGGSTATYQYDAFNQLKSVSRDFSSTYNSPGNWTTQTYPAGVTNYTTNALGQRISKAGATSVSRFVYGSQNTLLTEYTNGLWTSYIWLGNEPIAMVRNNQLFFIHNDHLGRPEVVTDSANSARWVAANYAFDRAVLSDSMGGLNLGLPGQYYDAETGFWYNGFRDYDSRVGGYLQSDPVGLSAGLNTYSYVSGNPITRVDPFGLTQCDVDFAMEFARTIEGQTVPTSVLRMEFREGHAGRTWHPNDPTNPVPGQFTVGLNSRFWGRLTRADLDDLFEAIVHEGDHIAQPEEMFLVDTPGRDAHHEQLTTRAFQTAVKYRDAYRSQLKCACP